MKLLAIITLTLITANAFADVYSWEDKNGKHFVDDPSKVPVKYRGQMKADRDSDRIAAENERLGYTKKW